MPDYTNTIIYKICSKDPNITDIYVGSTCNFTKRKYVHKSDCNNEISKSYNYKIYKFIRENGGWDAFDMVPIEKLSCKDHFEKTIRERYWFETLKAGLNAVYPNRSEKEYYADNINVFKEKAKQYYTENAETIKTRVNKYRADFPDKVKETNRKKYINNIDKIKARASKIVVCECGSSIQHTEISRHRKTTKHTTFIDSKAKEEEPVQI